MMDGCSESEDQFFDTRNEITSVSDLGSDCSKDCCSSSGFANCLSESLGYEFWTKNPESINERRRRFLDWMGSSIDWNPIESEELGELRCNEIKMGIDRIAENSGAVLRNLGIEDPFLSSGSSASCRSTEATEPLEDNSSSSEENSLCKIKSFNGGTENSRLNHHQEVGLNQTEGFQRSLGSSSLVKQFLQKEAENSKMRDLKKKVKRGWLSKLNVIARIAGRQGEASLKPDTNSDMGFNIQRVRVHPHRKRSKELSSLYASQEVFAHNGSILTMKFSPDGQYLASAGEDGIVRVWKVIEADRPNNFEIQDTDPSSLYFFMNHSSKLATLNMDKDKIAKMKRLGKSSESSCVIFPPKVFEILEKPLHEFHGHSGDVLALSWSNNGYLLSSSVDKTVCLWQVGRNQCLRVFAHNNYVTSVDFNPMDDNFFISGSIDGKVRIWEVQGCQVVDWTDIREIVAAVCYCPDGKRGIVGSIDGTCRFYDITDNLLQLESQICLKGKKKLPSKRITGFQFSPSDPSKVMVTSADSQIQILSGVNVICKFKGTRSSGSQVPAFFTSDGKHIVRASEDSNVHVWNYNNCQDKTTSSKAKNIWSSESFLSNKASIALPWCGMKIMCQSPKTSALVGHDDDLLGSILRNFDEDLHHQKPSSSPDCFSLSRGFFLETLPKGTATWPEEKLPSSSPTVVSPSLGKSEYKVLKSVFQNTSSSHMWGLVIVTAGSDGRIRTYQNYGLPIHP